MSLNYYLSILIIIVSSLMLFIGIWCFRKREVKGARTFSVLILAMVIHSFGYALELTGTNLSRMFMFIRVEYIGVAFYPYLLITFTSEYTDEKRFANRVIRAIFLSLNIATFFIVQTNSSHKLYYSSISEGSPYGFPLMILEPGPWYGVQTLLLFTAALYSIVIFIYRMRRLDRNARKRAGFLLIGILIPCITAVLSIAEVLPKHIDFSPVSYFLLVINYITGLFRYRLFLVSELSHEMILDTIEEAVIVISDDGYIINRNAAVAEYFSPLNHLAVGDKLSDYPDLSAILDRKSDEEISIDDNFYQLKIIPYQKQHCTLYVFSNITQRTAAKLKLEKLAVTDPLTGVYNRRYFISECEKEIKEALRYKYPVSAIMLDIDDFKNINDRYGHKSGDAALCRLTEICLEKLREMDILARYGGEEFVIMLPHTDCPEAVEIGERLREEVLKDGDTNFTISLGVSCLRGSDIVEVDQLINESDKAMYFSKRTGKNRTSAYNALPEAE